MDPNPGTESNGSPFEDDFEVPAGLSEKELSALGSLEKIQRQRKFLLGSLAALLILLIGIGVLFYRYLVRPAPLPDIVAPLIDLSYPPHYLFSIYGVDQPVGVAVSPTGDRVYVTETGGERLVRIFDREGDPLGTLAPPDTSPGERSPVYLTTDGSGRIFVTDRLQHAVFIYSPEGNFLDTILGPDLTLSEYVSKHTGAPVSGTTYSFNAFSDEVVYQPVGGSTASFPAPDPAIWAPLGIRIDQNGTLFLTDVDKERNSVREIPLKEIGNLTKGGDFNPAEVIYGTTGPGDGEFLFPNAATTDSQSRVYVSDGNNGRISVWNQQRKFIFNFGQGTGEDAISLPRGLIIDARDRLHVVDVVGQNVKVFDVSGPEPAYLFSFGDFGQGDGMFNFPSDIAMDTSGRLYIADRENNRVQVWSY